MIAKPPTARRHLGSAVDGSIRGGIGVGWVRVLLIVPAGRWCGMVSLLSPATSPERQAWPQLKAPRPS